MTNLRICLLHVEDDYLWQTTIAAAVAGMSDIRKFETVTSAAAALDRAPVLRPDVVVLDVVLPDGDGLAVARTLAALKTPPRIVLLSVRRDDVVLQAACSPHIAALLWKTGDVLDKLPEAIRTVAAGGKYHPPDVREALRKFRADPQAYFKILSDRELELLPRFGEGLSDEEVATLFGLSIHTVKSHRQNILTKLGLHSTARLIHWAIMRGFVRPPSDGWVVREDGEPFETGQSGPP
ncbi:MAG: response regulator transcription factor [Opitutae bacterium]|nr:response regulator transcription factor [Opitutae bacterium]